MSYESRIGDKMGSNTLLTSREMIRIAVVTEIAAEADAHVARLKADLIAAQVAMDAVLQLVKDRESTAHDNMEGCNEREFAYWSAVWDAMTILRASDEFKQLTAASAKGQDEA